MRPSALAMSASAALLLAGCLAFHPGPLPGEPSDATFLEVGDTRLRVLDTAPGAGAERPTVVLVHGFGAAIEEWAALVGPLTGAGYRVVAPDLRGHGWSGRPEGDYSIEAQADLVLALADRLGVGSFSLVGHSWGSAVALAMALKAPARVGRIALFNGMFFEAQQPVLFSWARLPGLGELIYGVFYAERQDEKLAFAFHDPEAHVPEALVERLDAFMARPGTLAAALAGVRAMRYSPLQARYGEVAQPVLLVWGRDDRVTPLQWGERMVHALPRARLVVVPRSGHLPMVETPGASAQALLGFLREGTP